MRCIQPRQTRASKISCDASVFSSTAVSSGGINSVRLSAAGEEVKCAWLLELALR